MKPIKTPSQSVSVVIVAIAALTFGFASASAEVLYVANANASQILEYTAPNTFTIFASGISSMNAFALDSTNNLYVSCSDGGGAEQILKFTGPDTFSVFASGLSGGIFGLAFDHSGTLYAVTNSPGQILAFTAPNTYSVFASGLSSPFGIASDSANNVFVSEPNAGNIFKFTAPNTSTLFASEGSNSLFPSNLAVDSSNNLFVSNYHGQVRKFTGPNSGSDYTSIYTTTLNGPTALAFNNAGDLFVANRPYNPPPTAQQIQDFTAPNTSTVYANGLNNPTAMVFAPAAVPEASTLILFITGTGSLFLRRRSRTHA